MIGFISGTLQHKANPLVIIVTHGVGYELETSMTTFLRLPEIGSPISLITHLSIREDAHVLYGFSDEAERFLFRTLVKINGIGPKLALGILSNCDPSAFKRLIQQGSVAELTQLPGIGKKTAERLLIEMRDKLAEVLDGVEQSPTANTPQYLASQIEKEAMSALLALGYKPIEASRLLNTIDKTNLTREEIIRLALQQVMVAT